MASPSTYIAVEEDDLTIRPFDGSEEEADIISRIWADGLQQTVESSGPWVQPLLQLLMDRLKTKSLSKPYGDMSSLDAINNAWTGSDRMLFVAEINRDSDTSEPPIIVGLCSIIKGLRKSPGSATDWEKLTEQEQKQEINASIFRLSVDVRFRGHGIGYKLMKHCETWAKQESLEKVWLLTGNSAAGNFYTTKCGYRKLGWSEALAPWYQKNI